MIEKIVAIISRISKSSRFWALMAPAIAYILTDATSHPVTPEQVMEWFKLLGGVGALWGLGTAHEDNGKHSGAPAGQSGNSGN